MACCLAPDEIVDGRFRIVRHLGSGGMGHVYEAHDTQLERRVAVKVLRQRSDGHAVARERLQREARAASCVSHPGVVRVLEVGFDGERDFVVMELLQGEDLSQRLERAGRLELAQVDQLARELCDALAALHEAGVVHRDLKPKNLFLARDEAGHERLKVLDLGLAKAAFLGASLTETKQVFGTLQYLSPEQLRSATLADERSDIWALGAILYEALTGLAAFAGEHAPEVVLRITTSDPPPVHRLRPDAPPALTALLRRALQRDPALRYQTVGALRAALDARDCELLPLARLDAVTADLTHVAPLSTLTPPAPTGAPSKKTPWVLGALAAVVAVGWLVHADASRATPTAGPARAPALALPPAPITPPMHAPATERMPAESAQQASAQVEAQATPPVLAQAEHSAQRARRPALRAVVTRLSRGDLANRDASIAAETLVAPLSVAGAATTPAAAPVSRAGELKRSEF